MPSVIVLAPIAAQLTRLISLQALVPHDAVEQALRQHRENTLEQHESKLPADTEEFLGHYFAVVRAAVQLLGAPAFARLARFQDEIEDEYMPGGPPMSPIYDSFAMQFVLGSMPQGVDDETPYSVLARLLSRDASYARLQRLAQSLGDARFELYRVKSAGRYDAEIEPVRGGGALEVHLTGSFLRAGDWGLLRVLPFEGRFYIADSPICFRRAKKIGASTSPVSSHASRTGLPPLRRRRAS